MIMSLTSRITMYENISLTSRGGPGNDTMSLSILLVNNITDNNYGMANTVGVVMLVIGVIMLLAVQKSFRMNESYY